jgi:hypothetical protein
MNNLMLQRCDSTATIGDRNARQSSLATLAAMSQPPRHTAIMTMNKSTASCCDRLMSRLPKLLKLLKLLKHCAQHRRCVPSLSTHTVLTPGEVLATKRPELQISSGREAKDFQRRRRLTFHCGEIKAMAMTDNAINDGNVVGKLWCHGFLLVLGSWSRPV